MFVWDVFKDTDPLTLVETFKREDHAYMMAAFWMEHTHGYKYYVIQREVTTDYIQK